MEISHRLNIDELLLPISEDAPVGRDLRQAELDHPLYYQIKNTRNTARSQERKRAENGEHNIINPGEWKTIIGVAKKILIEDSKDLEITSWLCEALVRNNGFEGLYDGLALIKGLIENFWPDFYPQPDEDGVVTQLAALAGLAGVNGPGTLIAPIKSCLMTQSRNNSSFAFWQYEQSLEISQIKDNQQRENQIKAGGIVLREIETSAQETPFDFFINLKKIINDCLAIIDELHATLDVKQPANNPSLMYLRYALEECDIAAKNLTKNIKQPAQLASTADNSLQEDADISSPSVAVRRVGSLELDRDKALNLLQEVADFFKRTEIHSPVSYTLEQVIRWANLPLKELLEELIVDNNAYYYYCKLTGIEANDRVDPNPSFAQNSQPTHDGEYEEDKNY